MVLNVAIDSKHYDYRVNNSDLCIDQNCINKPSPGQHILLIDSIGCEVLD